MKHWNGLPREVVAVPPWKAGWDSEHPGLVGSVCPRQEWFQTLNILCFRDLNLPQWILISVPFYEAFRCAWVGAWRVSLHRPQCSQETPCRDRTPVDAKAEGRLRGMAGDMHRTSDFLKKTTDSIREPARRLRRQARPCGPRQRRAGPARAASQGPGPAAILCSGGAAVPSGLCTALRAAGMSAEAADREAATSSRPCTPPQTSWFEFVLEEALLEQHLQKPSPGACLAGRRLPAAWIRPGPTARPLLGQHRSGGCEASVRGHREPGTSRGRAAAFTAGSNAVFLISHYLSYLIISFLCLVW